MKRLLSLIIAVILISSVMMITTSAASAGDIEIDTSNYTQSVAIYNATQLLRNAGVSDSSAVVNYNQSGTPVVFGDNGKYLKFYVDLPTLLTGYIPNTDYISTTLTTGYSIAAVSSFIDKSVDPTGNTLCVMLTATGSNMQKANVTLNIAQNRYTTTPPNNYVSHTKVGELNCKFAISPTLNYATSFYPSFENGKSFYTVTNGTIIRQEFITSAKGSELRWIGGDVSVIFPKVANLTPVDLSVGVGYFCDNVDIPYYQMRVIDFTYPTTLADKAKVKVNVGYDFIYHCGKDINVYFVEQVEDSSTIVKGAKATFVGKAAYSKGALGEDFLEFALLDDTKLGTYILTAKTLTSGVTTGATGTGNATGNDKNTVMNPLPQLPAHQNPPIKDNYVTVVPNVNTGVNDIVTVAIVVAVISLLLAGFVALKKVK